MNHRVPDFEMEEDYSIATSSGSSRPKKSSLDEDEIMELLWQNGQVVVQSKNQRTSKKSQFGGGEATIQPDQSVVREIRSTCEEQMAAQQHLFMQEDEMASWLQYPLDDSSFGRELYADLLYSAPPPPPPASVTTVAPPPATAEICLPPVPPRPPIPTPSRKLQASSPLQNFVHLSRLSRARNGPASGPSSSSKAAAKESTVVESNETPTVGPKSMVSHAAVKSAAQDFGRNIARATETAGTSAAARESETGTCELTLASSPGGSGASVSASPEPHPPSQKPPPAAAAEDRKRKGRETDENERQSEDIEFESAEAKMHAHSSTSTKRSRAVEVHNLSERRRRDRINEKMRALQELIPRCNKSDKASMLDEAIAYLKSLQLQVQMMSMGCGMIPMMYPGVQQFMPAMGMGMGMGMGMEMGMNRPMVPYPSLLPGSPMPNPAASHMGPRFPVPPFHMSQVPVPEPSRIQVSNQTNHMLNPLVANNPNQPQIPNFVDPYQRYLGLQQAQFPLPQNQAAAQPSTNKPSSSKENGNIENHQSG